MYTLNHCTVLNSYLTFTIWKYDPLFIDSIPTVREVIYRCQGLSGEETVVALSGLKSSSLPLAISFAVISSVLPDSDVVKLKCLEKGR